MPKKQNYKWEKSGDELELTCPGGMYIGYLTADNDFYPTGRGYLTPADIAEIYKKQRENRSW